jgi:hypothetical protein
MEFTENQYPEFDWRCLVAYIQMLGTAVNENNKKDLISKITSICEKLENSDQAYSTEINYLILIYTAHFCIGSYKIARGIKNHDENLANQGIKHLKRSRDLGYEADDTPGALQTDAIISSYTSQCIEKFGPGFDKTRTATTGVELQLEKLRVAYESYIDQYGVDFVSSIACGEEYARALLIDANHRIDAWRLLNKLISSSRRIHGSEHEQTLKLKELFNMIHVVVVRDQDYGVFQALRYEGDQCVVQGPIQQPRIPSEEKVLKVTIHDNNVILSPGTPVICHGLKNAAYLNGKIGESRGYDKDARIEQRYGVLFDDESIIPKSVKPENLRILFELPESTEA